MYYQGGFNMQGMIFNGKHSFDDFGLIIEEVHINPPAKRKIIDTIPYMSGRYDFSTLGSNGEQIYDTRSIVVKFGLLEDTRDQLYTLYSDILEWLIDIGQNQLIFDFMPDYYFLGEVEGIPTWDEFINDGDLTITFVADPFKYLRENVFITVTREQSIFNPFIYCKPSIRVYGSGNFILNGKATVVTGTFTDINYLTLLSEENTISFDGSITKVEITPNWRRL